MSLFRREKSATDLDTDLDTEGEPLAVDEKYQAAVARQDHFAPARPGYWVRPPAVVPAAQPPGYYTDPSGQHEQRWWDGSTWTAWVADGSRATIDRR